MNKSFCSLRRFKCRKSSLLVGRGRVAVVELGITELASRKRVELQWWSWGKSSLLVGRGRVAVVELGKIELADRRDRSCRGGATGGWFARMDFEVEIFGLGRKCGFKIFGSKLTGWFGVNSKHANSII
ncbi:hypothetical protein LINPERPRIM_LOCUS15103 [Linum perenne]